MISNFFSVHLLSWENGQPLLRAVREALFMREQGIFSEYDIRPQTERRWQETGLWSMLFT